MARRRGMTLIELLVVVSILLMLALIAIPAVRPGIEGQRTREAARSVNVFLSNARNRAEVSGRPYGVEIERLTGTPLASAVLHQVEVPPPYAGDFQNSRIAIDSSSGVVTFPQGDFPYNPGLIRRGDMLKLNYQGHVWRIDLITPDPDRSPDPPQPAPPIARTWALSNPASPPPNTTASGPVPFQIFRQPVRTMVTPLQLPRGTVIDLTYSGFAEPPGSPDPTRRFLPGTHTDLSPVRILFSPNGAVSRVWVRSAEIRPTEPIFLMVGRRPRVPTNLTTDGGGVLQIDGGPADAWTGPSPAEDLLTNLADLGNFWITIQPSHRCWGRD